MIWLYVYPCTTNEAQVILYWLKLTLPVHLHITYFTYLVYLHILEAMLSEISNTGGCEWG